MRAVIVGKAPLKTKLEALAGMEAPSETFLLELVALPETHSKLKLKATERLKRIQHTREVDRILAEEALRLGLSNPSDPVAARSEKPLTEPVGTLAVPVPLAESPVERRRIQAPVACQEPIPATIPDPAPVVDTSKHPKSTATPADPMPIFTLPRGSFISHDEQSRLLQLFRIVADTGSASERRGARFQLDRVVAIPDAARSLFAIYLLAMLDWLERNPEQRIPQSLSDNSPVMESDIDYQAFSLTFSVNQWLRQQAEEDRARRQIERANAETKGGGMWEGLPAI